jgi:hypothetical protein
MNSEIIESELENCLNELHSICEHLERPQTRWKKIKARVIEWRFDNDMGETLFAFAVWIGLFVGVPLLCSTCGSKNPPQAKSPHGDVVAQYTVTYSDGEEDWEEINDDL